MSTTPSQPQMSWGPIRDQVAEDAKTLNASELADKYGVNRWTMRRALARLGITPVPGGVRWAEKLPEIREQAKTKTVKQLAAHFNTTPSCMYAVLNSYEIKYQSEPRGPLFEGGIQKLTELAKTMCAADIAKHLGVSDQTVRDHLSKNKISCLKSSKFRWDDRLEEIKRLAAEGLTCAQLAKHFECTNHAMYTLLVRKQIQVQKASRNPQPAKTLAKREGSGGQATRQRKPTTPKPQAMPKIAATTVMPDNVKFTRAPFKPGADARVCNGSSTETYKPALHGGATTSYRR